jgi:hypothetical protein
VQVGTKVPKQQKILPEITGTRAAVLFRDALSHRRLYIEDSKFFRMSDFWDWYADGDTVKVKPYNSPETDDHKRKAGVIAFAGKVILTTDKKLLENAQKGEGLSNFILAHELAHLALNHHATGKVVKNFQLFLGTKGMSNIPPTVEELETNIFAVFFQCGVALLGKDVDPVYLAKRSFTEVSLVKQALKLCRLMSFQQELSRPRRVHERVVL